MPMYTLQNIIDFTDNCTKKIVNLTKEPLMMVIQC